MPGQSHASCTRPPRSRDEARALLGRGRDLCASRGTDGTVQMLHEPAFQANAPAAVCLSSIRTPGYAHGAGRRHTQRRSRRRQVVLQTMPSQIPASMVEVRGLKPHGASIFSRAEMSRLAIVAQPYDTFSKHKVGATLLRLCVLELSVC